MAEIEEQTSPSKKLKINSNDDSVHDNLVDLSTFKSDTILSNNTNAKRVCLKGTFTGRHGVGLVILEKTAFAENQLTNDSKYFANDSTLRKEFSNDIYGNYKFFPNVEFNGIKTTIIHPATDKHIVKYSSQNIYLIDETFDIYQKVVLPYLEKEQFSLQWVYNILNHTSEKDRIIFEDSDAKTGFILLPDLKWDGKTLETLYLVAIVHQKNIKSLRDLTDEHLPLLKNILQKGTKAIQDKYGLNAHQLRIYLHYQPSFYHLHIHFTYLKHDAPGIFTEKSHMLSNVISNLELLPDYYKKVTIPFVVRETDNLFNILVDEKIIQK